MQNIQSSAYLRDNYNEISNYCHQQMEPVIITNNGHEDLAVMSIEAYNNIFGKNELYQLLAEAEEDVKAGRVSSADEFFENFLKEIS